MLNFSISARLDAEFFKKEYLKQIEKLVTKKIYKLKNVTSKIDVGFVGAMSDYYREEGIVLLQTKNISEFFINDNDSIKITELFHKQLEKSQINFEDILIARSGSFGKASIYLGNETVNSSDIIIIQADNNIINPYYLTCFLNSKFGVTQMIRFASGGLQGHVNLTILEELQVPIHNKEFQDKIQDIIVRSYQYRTESKHAYTQAETLLLAAVGLQNFEPTTEKVNIKNFKDSFLSTGRLDAEYYQMKYEEIENRIKVFSECDTLGNLILRIDTGEYSEDYFSKNEIEDLTFFIRSTNIKAGQVEIDDAHFVKKDEFTKIAKKGDIITARVGSVGIFGEIRQDIEGSVYSDNVLCFQLPNNYIPSVYTILFNTNFYFDFIDRLARGSVQQRLNQETLKDLIIPKIEITKQKQIAELVEESFRLKKESEELLELAKRMVEVAIEEGEERAMMEPFLFSVETEKPEIIVHLSITKDLPAELFEDVVSELNKPGIITIPSLRENFVFAAATEWILPTAVIVGFVLKSYADGFLNEMGKEHYQVFKAGIKKIIRKIYGLENKIISTKPIDPKNDQSNIFSIETATKTGKPVKFLFNKDVPLADWDAYVDIAVDLMEQHYKNDENELDRQIAEMEQPVSNPIFIKYNKKSLRWEVVDMQKMVRAEYEAQKKMKK